ncbi:MAG: hypothetical protein RL071_341 [Pseudomonadota bacterium]
MSAIWGWDLSPPAAPLGLAAIGQGGAGAAARLEVPVRPPARRLLPALLLLAAPGCEDARKLLDDGAPPGLDALDCAPVRPLGGRGPAAQLAAGMGLPDRLLVGLGNDAVGRRGSALAYTLGPRFDVHYLYLVGLPGRGGWDEWNPGGRFVDIQSKAARSQCQVPMFTLYAMAVDGEANMAALTDRAYMRAWWQGYTLALDRLGRSAAPSILHVEPDFWGFVQQRNPGRTPDEITVLVADVTDDCGDVPDTLAGMGACLVRKARARSPGTRLGLHASTWAAAPAEVAAFLNGVGARDTDLLVVETLDRDAGCFEARAPDCVREDGPWYWDADERSPPHLGDHLDKIRALHEGTGLPILWWQTPLGVPAEAPGGSPGAYRDNRVPIFFAHTARLVEAGGVGILFGAGWEQQTTVETDGGQLKAAAEAYLAAPTPLP